MTPQNSRPRKPRASATLRIICTASPPNECCVMPMLHTNTAERAAPIRSANSSTLARDKPLPASMFSQVIASVRAASSAKPVVCASTNARSTLSVARSRFSTP